MTRVGKKSLHTAATVRRLEDIPNIGKAVANDLRGIGITAPAALCGRDPYALYHDRLIPQTELALETNLARYRTSSVEFMSVIDNVRMLLRYRKELAMAVKEYHAAYSELSALMGVEVLQ